MTEFPLFATVVAIAAVAGLVATKLRQPLLIAFIAVGIAVGPVGTGWIDATGEIDVLAELGISVLLFLVGLKLDVHLIRVIGPVALATGLGQVVFTSAVGFGLALLLGMEASAAVYVAVALTFSSTIIIVKLLSDKQELEELHGRIALGFLIVQDIVVVLVMIGLTAFGSGAGGDVWRQVLQVLGSGALLLVGTVAAARWLLPAVLPAVAKSSELLLLFAVAWAVALAATSEWLEFSTEVGAFLAGVAIASTAYREAIGARLVSLRDFLLLFFFLNLGAQLDFDDAGTRLVEAGVLSAFVLIGNPLIVLFIMGRMGYRARTGFLAGLTVAQISEFSLILAALGLSLGHIDPGTVSLITVVGLITITASTYMILSSKQLYDRLAPVLRIFERPSPRHHDLPEPEPVDLVLFGLGRFGQTLARMFVDTGHRVVAIDADPRQVRRWDDDDVRALFGDASDLQLLEAIPLEQAALLVSTLPSPDINVPLLMSLRQEGFQGTIVLVARSDADARRYAEEGADVVLDPYHLTGEALLDILEERDRP